MASTKTAAPASTESKFIRQLGARETLALALGSMIGWGWVVMAGDWISKAGSAGAVLGFVIAGSAIVVIALLYAELASAMPWIGGEHIYSLTALGPAGSFICTWAIVLGYVSVTAFETVALPTVFEYLDPDIKQLLLWQVSGYDVYLSSVLLGISGSIAITAVNVFGIRVSAVFQTVMVLLIIAAGLMLLFGALTVGDTTRLEPLFVNQVGGITAVIVMAPFMLVGFDVIPQAAEEIDMPLRRLGVLIVGSVILATVWYCLVILSVGMLMGSGDIAGSELVTADANARAWGPAGAKLLLLGGIAGIITSWNGFMVGGSRALYALAESGMLPRFLAYLHPVYRTPVNAILFIGLLSSFAPLFGRQMLVWVVDAGSFGIVVAYLMVAISFLVLRYKRDDMPRPYRLRHGKFMGGLGILLALALCILYLPGSPSALVREEWIVVLGWCLLGLAFFIFRSSAAGHTAPLRQTREE